jgi:hypothetical protein
LVVILQISIIHCDERRCVGWKVGFPKFLLHLVIKHRTSHEMRKDFCTPALALDAQIATTSAANAWCCATFLAALAYVLLAVCTARWTLFTYMMCFIILTQ